MVFVNILDTKSVTQFSALNKFGVDLPQIFVRSFESYLNKFEFSNQIKEKKTKKKRHTGPFAGPSRPNAPARPSALLPPHMRTQHQL